MTLPNGYKFRGKGVKFTITKNTTQDCDVLVASEREIDKLDLLLDDHHADDTITFQVVDVDNVLGYGAGLVLDEFATDWRVDDTKKDQGEPFGAGYSATVPTGTYLRFKYTSAGTTNNVTMRINLFLHEPPS